MLLPRQTTTEEGIQKRIMSSHVHPDEESEPIMGMNPGASPGPCLPLQAAGNSTIRPLQAGIRDPHIWLSPPLVMLQARTILQALLRVDAANAQGYEEGYRRFIMELVELDAELRAIFKGLPEHTSFMVFHPSWGYFAQAYGLEQVAVETEGKEPKPAELMHLIEDARTHGIRVIFVQPQFSTRSAAMVAGEIGAVTAVADPLAQDWARSLRGMAEAIRAGMP